MTLDTRKLLSLLIIPIYLILITIVLILNIWTPFNSPFLLLVFNSLFLGLIPLYIAYIAYHSFRASGSTAVLLQGTGMLMIGFGAIAAGIVGLFPDSMNFNVALHNTSFCIGAFLQLAGILIAFSGPAQERKPGRISLVLLVYGGCGALLLSFAVAVVLGVVPPFFVVGSGYTVIRQLIITNAIEFFALAAGLLAWLYLRKREDFFFWYSVGLALIAIGLVGATFNPVLGSPLSWVSRSAQYLGAWYVLLAFIVLNRSAQQTGIPLGDMLARFFGEYEASYKTLVETANDAIVVFDSTDRVIVWNSAAAQMFGYSPSEAMGSSFIRMAIPDQFSNGISNNKGIPPQKTGPKAGKTLEIIARRKDGSTFPAELTLSRHTVAGTTVSTCILRDLTERKREAQALRESEQRFRKIFENCPIGMVLVSPDFRFLSVNPAWIAMTGYTENELLGMSFKDITHPDHIAGDIQHIQELAAGKVPVYSTEKRYIRKDGSILWGFLKVTTIHDDQGILRHFAAQIEDITERRNDRENLTWAKEYAETLIRTANVMIIGLDNNGRITTFNQTAELITGYTAAELAGRNWFEVIVPKDRYPRVWEEFTKLLEGGLPEHFENPILTKSGEERYIVWRNSEIYNKGEITGTISFGIDITGRKLAEDAQRDLSVYNRGLIEAGLDPLVTISYDGKIQDVNTSTELVTGVGRSELIGTDFHEYFTDPEKARVGYRRVFSMGKVVNYPLEIRHRDGHTIPVLYNATVYHDENGNVKGVFAAARDITERIRSERLREHLIHELSQKNAELDRFVYTVSHDLKSPLITIRGFLGYLETDLQKNDMGTAYADIKRISTAVGTMQLLISTLLDLSRSGKAVNLPVDIPLSGLVQEAAGLLEGTMKNRGIVLDIDANLPVVSGDRQRLLQVMTNLLDNAVKFMGDQERPRVEVGSYTIGDEVRLFVRDNGMGIRVEDQPKIFGLFERLTLDVPGTGIGLATVKRIIEAHGGTIWVESEGAGKGTTFWFTLAGQHKERDYSGRN